LQTQVSGVYYLRATEMIYSEPQELKDLEGQLDGPSCLEQPYLSTRTIGGIEAGGADLEGTGTVGGTTPP
jgi:hypothetical protein